MAPWEEPGNLRRVREAFPVTLRLPKVAADGFEVFVDREEVGRLD